MEATQNYLPRFSVLSTMQMRGIDPRARHFPLPPVQKRANGNAGYFAYPTNFRQCCERDYQVAGGMAECMLSRKGNPKNPQDVRG